MMKKRLKFLLIGTGIAVTGFLAYTLLKNDREPIKAPPEKECDKKDTHHTTRTPTQECIERRRKKAIEMREARKAQQRQSGALNNGRKNTETEETNKQTIPVESEWTVDGPTSERPCVIKHPTKLE